MGTEDSFRSLGYRRITTQLRNKLRSLSEQEAREGEGEARERGSLGRPFYKLSIGSRFIPLLACLLVVGWAS